MTNILDDLVPGEENKRRREVEEGHREIEERTKKVDEKLKESDRTNQKPEPEKPAA